MPLPGFLVEFFSKYFIRGKSTGDLNDDDAMKIGPAWDLWCMKINVTLLYLLSV